MARYRIKICDTEYAVRYETQSWVWWWPVWLPLRTFDDWGHLTARHTTEQQARAAIKRFQDGMKRLNPRYIYVD